MTIISASIRYKGGYKYQLAENNCIERISIFPENNIDTPYIALTTEGEITVKVGYAWDGPSGTAIDTKNFMRGSLIHDALYQLLREKHIDAKWRLQADNELRRICIQDGMSKPRAWWVYKGVRWFASPAADPAHTKPVITAP